MIGKEVSDFLERLAAKLPLSKSISLVEAEKRASEFLEGQAKITNIRHLFAEDRIKLLSMQTAVYAEELARGTGKTVTENKTTAEASKRYEKAREALESIENDLSYLKAYYDIFQNAHVFYRQMAKGEIV